jgi:hypothetical protein
MGENVENKPLGTRIAYAFGLAIGISISYVKKAYKAVRYQVGFLGHLARNRQRYMLEFDKMTAEEENIRATVAALQKQNEVLQKRYGSTIDRFEKENDSFRLEGKKVPNYQPEDLIAKTRMSPEVARNTADRLLQNQQPTSGVIDTKNQFLNSGPREDKIDEVVKH